MRLQRIVGVGILEGVVLDPATLKYMEWYFFTRQNMDNNSLVSKSLTKEHVDKLLM